MIHDFPTWITAFLVSGGFVGLTVAALALVNGIVRRLEKGGDAEVPSTRLGELALEALAGVDEVAYVRFASVYRDFADARDFERFIQRMAPTTAAAGAATRADEADGDHRSPAGPRRR